jgi:hypothetical protein
MSRTLIPGSKKGLSWLGKLLRPGAFITLAVVLAYNAASQMANYHVFSVNWWKPGNTGGIVLLCLGIASAVAYGLVVWGYGRSLKKANVRDDLFDACRGLADFITSKTSIAASDVGVHVWEREGLVGLQHLVSIKTYRTAPRPPTDIHWSKGKGALGRCWEDGQTKFADLGPLHAKATNPTDFCDKLDPDDRWGLTWDEFDRTRQYAAVLATPIRKHGVRGCLSVDVRKPSSGTELRGLWNDPEHTAAIDAYVSMVYEALGVD